MNSFLVIEQLQERITQSELGQGWNQDPLMLQTKWSAASLGYTDAEVAIWRKRNITFEGYTLPWLELLAKLTIKAKVRAGNSLNNVVSDALVLRQLDKFLITEGCLQPEDITNSILKRFVLVSNVARRITLLVYATKLWAEEGWIKISFIPPRVEKKTPKVEIIPEEVLHQFYENLDLFPIPLERLFRLQLALGMRIGEVLILPRACLKREGEHWFILRWVEKRKEWHFYQIHSHVAELIQEQQRFLDAQFGAGSTFSYLFCWLSTAPRFGAQNGGKRGRFETEPIYRSDLISQEQINDWLQAFSSFADLRDKYGNPFILKSHMFRRTKACVMAYCEAEDEYIAAVLGHSSLDMLPHYRKRSLDRLERESKTKGKGYVDMYGRVTAFKPRKRRYERLVSLLKVSTPLGECHRPSMLGDCQHRYGCLSCDHHRVTIEDQKKLEADYDDLLQDLEKAKVAGQERRVTELDRLLTLVANRLNGLNELQILTEK